MPYKALFDIGEYKKGEVVPDELAEIWLKMYDVPHVESVEEESPAEEPVEDEPASEKKKEFEEDLLAIDGIGRKTVEDIIAIFPTEEELLKAIEEERDLPFRADVVDALYYHYEA